MSSANDVYITLLGKRLSKKGLRFIFEGEAPLCESCRLRGACLKLEKGRLYEVVGIRSVTHECAVFADGVVTVLVTEPAVTIAMQSKVAFEGATQLFEPIKCRNYDCENFGVYCNPPFFYKNDKLKILSVGKKHECPLQYELKQVTVRRVKE